GRLDVGPGDAGRGEADGDDEQAAHLGPLGQAEVALVHDLDPVVERAHDRGAGDGQHDQDAGAGEHETTVDVPGRVAGHRGDDDGDAAHGRRARLGDVAVGDVLVDRLAHAVGPEPVDEVAGAEQRAGEADG